MKQKLFSILHWFLIKKSGWRYKNLFFRLVWNKLNLYSLKSYKGTIDFKLHGEWVKMNNGYPYPLFINTYYNYNHPLIEILYRTHKAKGRPIDYIEVGGAIGDTMLLLFKNCPEMIHQYFCIEGDKEFYEYLKFNLRNHSNGIIVNSLLSDYETKKEKSLVRTHLGTASSLGNNDLDAITLDELMLHNLNVINVDLIKIDVDGLDGKIIAGAVSLLEKFKPVVIFEWHPLLYKKTNNSFYQPFTILRDNGYKYFIFYDKLGNFNHMHYSIDNTEIDFLIELCLRNNYGNDWHYDIVAFNSNSISLDILELAEMEYSKRC